MKSFAAEYRRLLADVTLWDVSVERNVEIAGRDGLRFAELLTPRDLSKCRAGEGRYVLLTDDAGGIVNDPVLLRLEENRFWLACADSDVLLWAKGVARNCGMDVQIRELDVAPLQIQGPKSRDLVGGSVRGAGVESRLLPLLRNENRQSPGDRHAHRSGPASSATSSTCSTRRRASTCGTACSRPERSTRSRRPVPPTSGASRPASSTTAST
jgi:hypothetical protein